MEKINPKIELLIYRFLQGELSESERQILDSWLQEGKHREWFERICDKENILQRSFYFDRLDKERENTWRKLEQKSGLRRRAMWRRWVVAASLVIPLLVGMMYQMRQQAEPVGQELYQDQIMPGMSVAQLRLPDGNVVNLSRDSAAALQLAGGSRLVNDQGTLTCEGDSTEITAVQYSELCIPRGGEYKVVLPDGTTVWLNAESALRFPGAFPGKERRVYAKGELYFDVVRDEERPFIVEVEKDYTVEVLGTEFNLRAYGELPRSTTLVRGSVRVRGKEKEVLLKSGQQAFEATGTGMKVADVDVAPFVAWREGKFYFVHASLKEIMEELGRWYDVRVVFEDTSVMNDRFSIEMKRFDDFNRVLRLIEKTGMVKLAVDGHTVIVK